MTPQSLLSALRVLNTRVRVDGDLVRCKAPQGVAILLDLAEQIRALKPGLLDLLREEVGRVDRRRVAQTVRGTSASRLLPVLRRRDALRSDRKMHDLLPPSSSGAARSGARHIPKRASLRADMNKPDAVAICRL